MQVVSPPIGTVSQDADIALACLLYTAGHVPGKLRHRIPDDSRVAQILLNLDDSEADFNVDPSAAGNGRLQLDIKIVLLQAQATAQQQIPNICLYCSLASNPVTISQAR